MNVYGENDPAKGAEARVLSWIEGGHGGRERCPRRRRRLETMPDSRFVRPEAPRGGPVHWAMTVLNAPTRPTRTTTSVADCEVNDA